MTQSTTPNSSAPPVPAPVLAYATSATIPTFIRFNTAHLTRTWGFWIRILGILALNIEICVYAYWIIDGCYSGFGGFLFHMLGLGGFGSWGWYWWGGGGGPRGFEAVLSECTETNWPFLLFGVSFLLDGLFLFLVSHGIRLGSRMSAALAIFALLPVALVLLAATLSTLSAAIFQTITGGSPWFLLFLLPTAIGILVLVLMVGIFRQLAWVCRNPDLERAPLHFWPRRRKPQ